MMMQTKPIGAVLLGATASVMLALPASAQRLFFEDFNGLPLGPNVEEISQGQRVWTKTPPSGWSIDDTRMPGYGQPDYDLLDGMREWAGWAFADVKWWPTVDNQRRSEWVRATGAAAIADPDEWDDALATLSVKRRFLLVELTAAGLLVFTLLESPRESLMGLAIIAAGFPFYWRWKKANLV